MYYKNFLNFLLAERQLTENSSNNNLYLAYSFLPLTVAQYVTVKREASQSVILAPRFIKELIQANMWLGLYHK